MDTNTAHDEWNWHVQTKIEEILEEIAIFAEKKLKLAKPSILNFSPINQLNKLSVVIPARNEAENLNDCISEISNTLNKHKIIYEILLIDDGSTDNTKEVTQKLQEAFSSLHYLKNENENGFGRAIRLGLDNFTDDAVAIMMADRSDSPEDLIQYWQVLLDGSECAFGSRFIKGSKLVNYPRLKLLANRVVNIMISYAFKTKCNDVTNAFKMYRREVIDGCKPLISPHFNLTVEIPLKAIVRGYTW